MTSADEYTPEQPEFRPMWEALSQEARTRRYALAVQREAWVKAVASRPPDQSERAAVRDMPGVDRTSLRRWTRAYEQLGFDGLIDLRYPVGTPPTSSEVREHVCTLRRLDPSIGVGEICIRVKNDLNQTTSETSVKRFLNKGGLSRASGRGRGPVRIGQSKLELGGMKLLEAAFEETGYLKAMTDTLVSLVAAEIPAESTETVDRTGRDEYGRIAPGYNERNRKEPGASIGPAFESVVEKAERKDMTRLHIAGATPEVIERKLLALTTCHILGNGRWDGLRTERGRLLGELCGFEYMPSTLDLMMRELKYLGAADALWETHGVKWSGLTAQWGTPTQAAVLFVDVNVKPIWTDLFSQSSKVSSTGRIMPSIETVWFHTGYGVPVLCVTKSGRAPEPSPHF